MAKKPNYVWGIDIGQCGLKALRCLEEDGQVVADAFDYIEYPKILSQPEADPEALVQEALEQFLSRNEVVDAKVAISVPGQSGLAKFFKPPPVDVKRIPDIVQYEAKQQIPFALEEVIWDFQQMAGGTEVDGFAIDTEVGLFAMKREQVFRYLQPFDKAEIELDIVQLAPLSIYNFVSYDILSDGPDPDEFDPDEPPESIVILAMGTDATDLVITNGFRVWQRSIPLGGNHFTKQLTKELKLTFAKAEHLKRNARQAEDPKAVFQAMRPIFNDLVTEVQRSIGFFQGIDRKAKIRGVVLLGNTVKLPGLQQYVAKNLGYEVIEFEKYNLLGGPSVVSSPAFTDNVLAFGVSYGLCLQGLKKARLLTSLLPREITTARIVRAKKPWAIASLSTLMLACAFSFVFTYSVWSEVQENAATNGVTWEAAEAEMAGHKTTSDGFKAEHENQVAKLKFMAQVGEEVVGSGDRRIQWLELMKAITAALPVTQDMPVGEYVSHKDKPLEERQELYIGHIESEYFPDLSTWWANNQVQVKNYELMAFLKKRFPIAEPVVGDNDVAGADTGDSDSSDTMDELDTLDEQDTLGEQDGSDSGGARLDLPGPTGPGWIIEIEGYHYFNKSLSLGGAVHVRSTLLKELERGSVVLPNKSDGTGTQTEFTMKELGIGFPILAVESGQPALTPVPNPDFAPTTGGANGGLGEGGFGGASGDFGDAPGALGGAPGGLAGPGSIAGSGRAGPGGAAAEGAEVEPQLFFSVKKHSFTVQFVWQENRLTTRVQEREDREKALQEAAADAAKATAEQAGSDPATPAAGDAIETEEGS